MITSLQLALVVLSAYFLIGKCSGINLRGIDPKLRHHYVSGVDGSFKCIDGLKNIPFSHVNDDYCDCFDGSDEPGTSACPNGKFYCRNAGYQPLRLNASFVDDGVCDCCDGTDEQSGKCANRCQELGAESLKALKADINAAEAGVKAKQKYISQAGDLKKKWAKRVEEVESEIAEQQQAVDAAAGKRDELQTRENQLQEQTRKQENLAPEADAQDGQAPSKGEGAKAAVGDQSTGEGGGSISHPEREESPEEMAKRVASQWIPGAREDDGPSGEGGATQRQEAEKLGEGRAAKDEEQEGDDFEDEQEDYSHGGEDDIGDEDLLDEDDEALDALADEDDEVGDYAFPEGEEDGSDGDDHADGSVASSAPPRPHPDTQPMPNTPTVELRLPPWAAKLRDWAYMLYVKVMGELPVAVSGSAPSPSPPALKTALDLELEDLRKELSQARSEFHTQDRKLKSLKTEQEGLKANLERSYGPNDEYAALVDKCIDAKVDKYTYQVCPFGSATQKEGHSSTSLGKWQEFGGNFSSMKFTGGQGCWQGPPRSMEVALKCGPEEVLTRVEEPSRCEYHAELATPAACSAEALQALREELAAREREMKEGSTGHDEL